MLADKYPSEQQGFMDHNTQNTIVNLPMTVIRRLDALLEQTKGCRSQHEKTLDAAGIANQEAALCQASGEALTPRLRSKT